MHGANTTAFLGHARFTGPRSLEVSTGDTLTADQVVIAAGGHPVVPDVVGPGPSVPFHTSDTVMRIEDLPARMVILGGGYIAAEFAHVFSALGVHVTLVVRGARLLRHLDSEVTRPVHRARLRTLGRAPGHRGGRPPPATTSPSASTSPTAAPSRPTCCSSPPAASPTPTWGWRSPGSRSTTTAASRSTTTGGRTSTGSGRSVTSRRRTSSSTSPTTRRGSWPHNLVHPGRLREVDHRYVPAAVFTYPQIASVGSTEDRSARSASPTSAPPRRTATRRTAGRWRTPPASASWWPTRARGGCSAPTSWGRRRPA